MTTSRRKFKTTKNRKNWKQIGRVLVNPKNTLAVKIAQAKTEGVAFNHRPSDEREAVANAQAKRERKVKKLRHPCRICARNIYKPAVICLECAVNKRLSEGVTYDEERHREISS